MNALIVRVNAVLHVRVPYPQLAFLFWLSSLLIDDFSFLCSFFSYMKYWFFSKVLA